MTSQKEPGNTALDTPLSQRDGQRRPIPWEQLDPSGLDEEARLTIGETWRSRRKQEHLAVGAFAWLTMELASEGCDPVVLTLISRAVSDEARHAEICRRLAVAFLGDNVVPPRVRGMPRVPRHPEVEPEARTLLHVVEMCCLSETFTRVYLTEMLSRAQEPVVRAAIEQMLEDKIDHGGVGWVYLESRQQEGRVAGLAEALPEMLERTMGRVMQLPVDHPEPDRPELEAFGYLGNDAGAQVFGRTLREVILPGCEDLGVDTGPARLLIDERQWLR